MSRRSGSAGVEVIEILDAAFRAKRAGAVEMPPKIGVHPREDAFIHAMPAYLADGDAVGVKWVAGYPDNQELGPALHPRAAGALRRRHRAARSR